MGEIVQTLWQYGYLGGWIVGMVALLLWIVERQRRQRIEQWLREKDRQRGQVIKGQIAEQMAPFLPDFPFHPKDARFIGSPVDYVVFDGMSEGKLRQVVLVEVKTNQSRPNPIQKEIERIVVNRRITFRIIRLHIDDPHLGHG